MGSQHSQHQREELQTSLQSSSAIRRTATNTSSLFYEYQPDVQEWSSETNKALHKELKLSVITWNVWFSNYQRGERYKEIFRICEKRSPTVLCFQEVTKPFLQMIEQENWIREQYLMTDASSQMRTINDYGVLILVKKTDPSFRVTKLHFHKLESFMNRNCVAIDVSPNIHHLNQENNSESAPNDSFIRIATVHLESLNSQKLRTQQISEICGKLLADSPHAMLMGDFNFDDEKNWVDRELKDDEIPLNCTLENEVLLSEPVKEFKDVWKTLLPNEKGKTFDTEVNPMIKGGYEVMRYDRIILKSHQNRWQPNHIEMIGAEPFMNDEDNQKVFPSDHFGLFCQFMYKY